MDKFKRRTSAPTLSLTVAKESATPTMTRRQSDGLVQVQRSRPTMPKYYRKGIDRETAERLLMTQPAGTYLVRDRQSSDIPGLFTLSMRDKTNQCRHFKIDTDAQRQLAIHGYPDRFESLEKLVDFFVDSQKKEIKMRPFGQDVLYEDMNDDISSYQDMKPVNANIKSHARGIATPSKMCQVNYENTSRKQVPVALDDQHSTSNYENVGDKIGRRLAPPLLRQNDIQSTDKMINTVPHNREASSSMYQNIPPKNETLPLPPRRYIKGTTKRQDSLPIGYENLLTRQTPPPPLPTRPHLNDNYQNIPGKDTSSNPRRQRHYQRSLTHS